MADVRSQANASYTEQMHNTFWNLSPRVSKPGSLSKPTFHLPLPKSPAALTPMPQAKSNYWQCLMHTFAASSGTWLVHRLPGTLSLPPACCPPTSSGGLSPPEPVHQDRSPREANILHSSLTLGITHPSPCQRLGPCWSPLKTLRS